MFLSGLHIGFSLPQGSSHYGGCGVGGTVSVGEVEAAGPAGRLGTAAGVVEDF